MIHKGTSDLHNLQKDTAEAVKKMAEQASREFPNTRIVVSTLLPRTDTPPHVIHDINMEIRRGCATLSSVHLALHPTIDQGSSPSTLSSTRSLRGHPRPPPPHHHPRITPLQ